MPDITQEQMDLLNQSKEEEKENIKEDHKLYFGSASDNQIQEWINKYDLPIEAENHEFGEVVVRALSIEELDDMYSYAINENTGAINSDKYNEFLIDRCVLFPTDLGKHLFKDGNIPGGVLNSLISKIETISGIYVTSTIDINEYLKILNSENKNRLSKNHPSNEDLLKWKSEADDLNLTLGIVSIPAMETDYVYRGYTIKEMNQLDRDLGSLSVDDEGIRVITVQKKLIEHFCLYPSNLKEKMEKKYSMPAFLPALISEGIHLKAGGQPKSSRKIK